MHWEFKGVCAPKWVNSRLQCTMKETKITFLSGKYRSSSVVSSQGVQKLTDIQIYSFGLHFWMPSLAAVILKPWNTRFILETDLVSLRSSLYWLSSAKEKPQKAEDARTGFTFVLQNNHWQVPSTIHRLRLPGLLSFSMYFFITVPFPYSFPSHQFSRWRCASCTVG